MPPGYASHVMPMQRQAFHFGARSQDKTSRALGPDDLKEALNVRLLEDGRLEKARGTSRTSPSFLDETGLSSGNWTSAGAPSYLTGLDDGMLTREAADGEEWVYNSAENRWFSRGKQTRPFPIDDVVVTPDGLARQRAVITNDYEWYFAVGTGYYSFSVIDNATKETIVPPTRVPSANILNLCPFASVDGISVVVLVVDGTHVISRHTHAVGNPFLVPSKNTYHTSALGAGHSLKEVDAQSTVSGVFVWAGGANTSNSSVSWSLASSSGGAPIGSPAPVDTNLGAPGTNQKSIHGSILNYAGGNGTAYFAFWKGSVLSLYEITLSTLAAAATPTIDSVSYADGVNAPLFSCCGYVAANGARVIFATSLPTTNTAGPGSGSFSIGRCLTKRHSYTGSTTTTNLIHGHWVASKPKLGLDNNVYLLVLRDDGEQFRNQRTYFLIRDDASTSDIGKVWSQALRGLGPAAGNNSVLANGGDAASTSVPDMMINPVTSELVVPVLKSTAAGLTDFSVARLVFSFSEDFGPPIAMGHAAICPGPIPYLIGPRDRRRESSPLSSPAYIDSSITGGTTFICSAYYQYTDSAGNVSRSRPSPETGFINVTSAVINVPCLHHVLNPDVKAEIVLCVSVSGGATPQIRQTLKNDPTADFVSFSFTANPATDDVDIYTAGGALGNDPWPPCRCIARHRGRLVLGGLDEPQFIQPTREFEPGISPSINVVTRVPWFAGTGDIKVLGRVDGLTLGLLRGDAVGVIEGNGPNGRGQGNFVVKTVSEQVGAASASAFAIGPAGLYFQDTGSKIQVLTSGQTIREASGGIDDLVRAGYTLQTGIHDPDTDQMVFSLIDPAISDPVLAYLDYRHPTESHVAGRWFLRRSSNLVRLYAATRFAGETWWIEANGILRREWANYYDQGAGASVPVLPKVRVALPRIGEMLGGDVDLRFVTFLGERFGSHTFKLSVYRNGSSTPIETKTRSNTAAESPYVLQVETGLATGCSEVEIEIEEVADGGNLTKGFALDGIVVDYQTRGRTRLIPASRVL